ncbi:unnamed protein product [Pieris macdunnoughi]|uniref:Uncharacterized protein n=1 Tax=Pieris macdunnoughi TaxID=345717 RepID=A0A821QUL7_9NEOP|nr:unnamed protein product [Pieris macdunnoughi]
MYLLIFISLLIGSNCQSLINSYFFSISPFYQLHELNTPPKNKECCGEDRTRLLVRDLEPENEIVRTLSTPDFDLREVYRYNGYELKYKFKEIIQDSSQLEVNCRAVCVILKLESGKGVQSYRILPEGMRINDAVWRVDDDELVVNIPYEHRNIEIPESCPKDSLNPMDLGTPFSPDYRMYWLHRYGINLDKEKAHKDINSFE